VNTLPIGIRDDQGRPFGLFLNMPEAEYHAVKAFSFSGSKHFARSPAHFQAYLRKEWEVNPEREKFKAVHLLTLEAEEEHSRIAVKDGRWAGAVKDEVIALQKEGKLVLKPDAFEEAKAISASLKCHELAGKILSRSMSEVSVFAMIDGVYCKGRIDSLYVDPTDIFIGDLKNFGDLSRERLIAQFIHDKKFYWQMYFYTLLIEAVFEREVTNHYWFFVEDSDPHGVKVRNYTDAMEELAAQEMNPLIDLYKKCTENNNWPSYTGGAEPAGLPSYAWENEK
jgi:hypothetical protein